MKKLKEFNILEYIKTKEDLDNLINASIDPYAEALSSALIYLNILASYYKNERRYYGWFSGKKMGRDMSRAAYIGLNKTLSILKKEGITPPIRKKKK